MPSVEHAKETSSRKVAERDKQFNKEWIIPTNLLPGEEVKDVSQWIPKSGFLSAKEIEITETLATQLLSCIKSKRWSSLEITKAFCHRASIAHQLVNCLTEVFFEEAYQTAEKWDKYYEETGELKGAFHGLPISLKDELNIKGYVSTIGLVSNCYNPEKMEEDAVIVKVLRDAGAVFYVKTNTPPSMALTETYNRVYGLTVSSLNRELNAGGSSGGEAALVKLRGSPLGVGSDIGGSIRVPAAFQNMYGLKSSFGRFPTYGCRPGFPGLESIQSVNGPIANTLEDVVTYTKTIFNANAVDYDPDILGLKWRDVSIDEKLNIAVILDDEIVRPTPPIRRGLKMTIEKLNAGGHNIIEWDAIELNKELLAVGGHFYWADGFRVLDLFKASGEELFPVFEGLELPDLPVSKLWDLHQERTALAKKFLDHWLETSSRTKNGKPIDAIIMPVAPFAACPNYKYRNHLGYSSLINILDYCSCTFPVTRADKNIDIEDEKSSNYGPIDDIVWKDYNAEQLHGGPVALQIVCRRLQEEKLLAMTKVVSEVIGYNE